MHRPKKLQKSLPLCHPKEKLFLKSLPSKIFKTVDTQVKQTENEINKITAKSQIYIDLTMTEDRRPANNSRFAKAGVLWFYDSEVLNSSFLLLM